ncbi:biopolymer transporter ExbD [Ectothiorhodospiraceae bacterium 2226]|nr:biopolymer transporter ExbD [Ectothiorhodospiraceae bacterium 2226]
MNLRRARPNDPEINLTPLIDVVFLLLIFFMVSTTFVREAEVSVDLPQASAQGAPPEEQAILEITIDAQGQYYVNGNAVAGGQIATLRRALREAAGDAESPRLVISADRNTPHQAVITAMDAARQVGFVRLTFATQQSDE